MLKLEDAFCSLSRSHWMGCDAYGSDLFSLAMSGAAFSLQVSLFVGLISVTFGLVFASIILFSRGFLRNVLLSAQDGFLSFPGLLLAILLASILPRSTLTCIFALSITGWAAQARFFEALMNKELSEGYITASLASGAGNFHLLFKHLWPSLLPFILIQILATFAYSLLGEASLSFLGLGAPIEVPSLGRLIADGREYLVESPHLSFFPGIVLFILTATLHLGSEWLRKSLDPAYRTRLY